MASKDNPSGGFLLFVAVYVGLSAPTAFFLQHEALAFLIVGIGCFLMLVFTVVMLVMISNQIYDRDARKR